ncbi:IscS subfamily cysteine desulfurase [Rossellomorea aquimaris]|uniref:IscS subfamily cysteine desulfurase n=1 Tax=Rossellomorea aquimaris TaxID=189382 RepID=UPI001CD401CE|nr:IscS subfamily cysteine desulfurase [Rossellomorea aquimaris]MCA1056298.1 IscS subfamily cysteine desulfurase [Rossellomorea aquimaris]
MLYFDYASTTPVDPECLRIYTKVSEDYWGNTSSLHDTGGKAKLLLENCRTKLGTILGVPPAGIHFTSGGTEGNHLALLSLAFSYKEKGKHIIIGGAEHSSIHSAAQFLEGQGFSVSKIPFTSQGLVNLQALQDAITEHTTVVSICHVNGEIGSIQPLHEIKGILEGKDILLHSDMVQSFGKLDIQEAAAIVDSFTISSHKIYGPKGIGAVYIHPRSTLLPYMPQQTHEHGFRGGTVNLPAIAGFVSAAAKTEPVKETQRVIGLRKHFLELMDEAFGDNHTIYSAPDDNQLPHVVGLRIHGIEGQWAMLECNRRGIHISTGSACQNGKQATPKTLSAMGAEEREGKEFIRISFGKDTSHEQVEELASALAKIGHGSYIS